MGRFKEKGFEDKLKNFLALALRDKNSEIFNKDGKPSPSKLVTLFKKKHGITVSRQTIASYLKMDLSKNLNVLDFSENEKIKEIREMMRIQKEICDSTSATDSSKSKAASTWKGLNAQAIDYEHRLREMEIRKVEASRPNYLIRFVPGCAERCCPNCGHKFYDNLEEDKKNHKNPWKLKSGEGQSTLDDGDEKKDEKN